jgi:PAS domain S-box-containing protein
LNGRESTLATEERLRLALDAGRMGTWEWDLETGGMIWSVGLERIFGLPPGGFDGTLEALRRAVHPEDRDAVLQTLAAAAEGGPEPHLEFRILRPDGALRWVESWGRLQADPAGLPRHLVGICADRTDRKRIEEALRLLAETNSVLAASLDPDAVLQAVAHLVIPLLADYCVIDVVEGGVPRRVAAQGLPGTEEAMEEALAYVTDLSRERHPMARAIRTGEIQVVAELSPEALESMAASPQHRELLARLGIHSFLAVPLVARGKTRGALGLLFGESGRSYRGWDMTLAEELARRVALAIDNLYLYHDARRAVRARDQVLAVVSHDLRNLLNPISISVDQLLAGQSPGDSGASGGRPLGVIRRSVEQMDRLILELLDAARLEEGRLVLERERLEVAALVGEVIESHLATAGQRAIRLIAEVADATPAVEGDRHRLLRVFANLVGNALKFTPAGGRIVVGAEPFGEGEVRFWVADTGPGIAEADQPHLFVPFWQATPQPRGGTGLGLSIVKRIVEAHGGRLWVDSRPGSGSVFFFTLAALPLPGPSAAP